MTSDFERRPDTSGTLQGAGPATDAAAGDAIRSGLGREASSARAELGSAADQIKDGAASLATAAREKASESVEAGKSTLASSLTDFAAAVRKASDELGERDQSMAAGLVRQVANGLEQATGSIEGRSVQDLTRSVATFARRQPTTFLIGAALVGVALGRFARASGETASSGPARPGEGQAYRDANDRPAGDRAPSRPVAPPVSPGTIAARSLSGLATSGSTTPGAGPASVGAGSTSGGPAPAEGPSGALLGHGSGSFNPQGGRDVR